MSMNGAFRQVPPTLLLRLKANPALVNDIIAFRSDTAAPATDADALLSFLPADLRKAIQQMPDEMRADFLAYANRSLASDGAMPRLAREQLDAAKDRKASEDIRASDLGEELNIAKAWHGVHFLLCGSGAIGAPPLGDAVLGGIEIGPDLGYGPARYLEPARVKAVSVALQALGLEEFERRYDAAALEANEVYPRGWSDETDRRRWLCDAYSDLRSFYHAAASGGFGVLLYLS